MKTTLALAFSSLILFACSKSTGENTASKTKIAIEVPENVAAVFKKQFPNAKNVSWEKEGDNYEAMFQHEVTETSMVIAPNGKILETETEMDSSTLPENILVYFDTNYKGYKIAEASKIVMNNGTIRYEAEVQDKDFIFDHNGILLEELN